MVSLFLYQLKNTEIFWHLTFTALIAEKTMEIIDQ